MLGLSGCERVRRAQRCQALARTINPAVDEISALTQLKPREKALKKISARYRKLADDLGPLSFAEQMAKEVARYQESVVEAARLTESMSEHKGATNGNRSKLERLKQQQITQVAKLNRWCKEG